MWRPCCVEVNYTVPLDGRWKVARQAHVSVSELLEAYIATRPLPVKHIKALITPLALVESQREVSLPSRHFGSPARTSRGWRSVLYGGFSMVVLDWRDDCERSRSTTDPANGVCIPTT